MSLVGTVAEGLVLTEAAPAQVHGLSLLDHRAVGVLDYHATGNLVGAVGQRGDDNFVFAHGRSMSGSRPACSLAWLEESLSGEASEGPVPGHRG